MRTWPRAVTITVVVVVAMVLALVVKSAVDRHHEYQRSLIEREIDLAQPFLALDENAELQLGYEDLDPNGLSGYGYVVVRFETDDPAARVREIKSVMRNEGWRDNRGDLMVWYHGLEGHIWVENNEVSVFIGVVEG